MTVPSEGGVTNAECMIEAQGRGRVANLVLHAKRFKLAKSLRVQGKIKKGDRTNPSIPSGEIRWPDLKCCRA